jgi:hypothetical protein
MKPPRPLTPLALTRRRQGLSQVQLALRTIPPCHPATVSAAERGALSRALAERFAAALGVTVEELLGDAPRGSQS